MRSCWTPLISDFGSKLPSASAAPCSIGARTRSPNAAGLTGVSASSSDRLNPSSRCLAAATPEDWPEAVRPSSANTTVANTKTAMSIAVRSTLHLNVQNALDDHHADRLHDDGGDEHALARERREERVDVARAHQLKEHAHAERDKAEDDAGKL